ncbi:hypothetical protein EJA72_02950 [Pseudomonas sp. PB120]|nr:hypothetical protein [Pseudomonas sp. PB120]
MSFLWRGSLLPLGCAAVVTPVNAAYLINRIAAFRATSRPSGSKLPRHVNPGMHIHDQGALGPLFHICIKLFS